MVRQTLAEGHAQVPGLKIYGLFAVSDRDVSEQHLVKYIVYYNDVCAGPQSEKLDGVATNNEAYATIKCADDATRVRYLDNLRNIVTEAKKTTTWHTADTLLCQLALGTVCWRQEFDHVES